MYHKNLELMNKSKSQFWGGGHKIDKTIKKMGDNKK